MDSSTVEPLSVAVQIGLRVPVILIALAGVLLALLMMRRLGALAAILTAAGSLLIAADQAAQVVWVLHLRSMTSGGDLDIDTFNSVNNAYAVADAVMITIGVALVVASLLLRRSPDGAAAVTGPAPWPAPPAAAPWAPPPLGGSAPPPPAGPGQWPSPGGPGPMPPPGGSGQAPPQG
ncbi:hypothetical protein Dvina_22695 [Dactylosporangium vinaceum]|uniref:Uncharacterized protein n=1 Tax=Dactylosporangium vinaceum TaxID=53362 RepID=A0ABV5M762_9ACTN|nr:hypothetical protein [Dactylosporangium vinaceum]UAC00609.1 hypothetical protein Dvina_22695 [Dactylosporangium vinaceum]